MNSLTGVSFRSLDRWTCARLTYVRSFSDRLPCGRFFSVPRSSFGLLNFLFRIQNGPGSAPTDWTPLPRFRFRFGTRPIVREQVLRPPELPPAIAGLSCVTRE
jgi:hypothetical protein